MVLSQITLFALTSVFSLPVFILLPLLLRLSPVFVIMLLSLSGQKFSSLLFIRFLCSVSSLLAFLPV